MIANCKLSVTHFTALLVVITAVLHTVSPQF